MRVAAGMQTPSRLRLKVRVRVRARVSLNPNPNPNPNPSPNPDPNLNLRLKDSTKHRKRLKLVAMEDVPSRHVARGEWPLEWVGAEEWAARERPSAEQVNASDALARVRREHVRNVFKRAWRAYERYTHGAPEPLPKPQP